MIIVELYSLSTFDNLYGAFVTLPMDDDFRQSLIEELDVETLNDLRVASYKTELPMSIDFDEDLESLNDALNHYAEHTDPYDIYDLELKIKALLELGIWTKHNILRGDSLDEFDFYFLYEPDMNSLGYAIQQQINDVMDLTNWEEYAKDYLAKHKKTLLGISEDAIAVII